MWCPFDPLPRAQFIEQRLLLGFVAEEPELLEERPRLLHPDHEVLALRVLREAGLEVLPPRRPVFVVELLRKLADHLRRGRRRERRRLLLDDLLHLEPAGERAPDRKSVV